MNSGWTPLTPPTWRDWLRHPIRSYRRWSGQRLLRRTIKRATARELRSVSYAPLLFACPVQDAGPNDCAAANAPLNPETGKLEMVGTCGRCGYDRAHHLATRWKDCQLLSGGIPGRSVPKEGEP